MAKRPVNPGTNLRVVVRMAPEIYVKLREVARDRRCTIGKLCVEGARRELDGGPAPLPEAAE